LCHNFLVFLGDSAAITFKKQVVMTQNPSQYKCRLFKSNYLRQINACLTLTSDSSSKFVDYFKQDPMPREVDLVIISDLHLGTYGCQAAELNAYLKSIKPKTLILNGDIIDMWQFNKKYFPKSHFIVLKRFLTLIGKGTRVIYITGNHDEALRRFSDLTLDLFELVDEKLLEIDNKKVWIFHGDVFDASVSRGRFFAKLGGWGYDMLIRLNTGSNWLLQKMGREKFSFSKLIKSSVKQALKYIGDFEKTAVEVAIKRGYDVVVCGHIHQPAMNHVENAEGSCLYLNSGDWIENCTALEYHDGQWTIFQYDPAELPVKTKDIDVLENMDITTDFVIKELRPLTKIATTKTAGV
jgi:UDP-2,3-diacylglucosamine pyrophosphatase LpxH